MPLIRPDSQIRQTFSFKILLKFLKFKLNFESNLFYLTLSAS